MTIRDQRHPTMMRCMMILALATLVSIMSQAQTSVAPDLATGASERPRGHVTLSYVLPRLVGGGADVIDATVEQFVLNAGGISGAYDTRLSGVSIHALQPIGAGGYASVSLVRLTRSDRSQYFHLISDDATKYQPNFAVTRIGAALGVVLAKSAFIQVYSGAGASFLVLGLNDVFWGSALHESAFGILLEAGADLLPLDPLRLHAAITFSTVRLTDQVIFTQPEDFGFLGITLGAGLLY